MTGKSTEVPWSQQQSFVEVSVTNKSKESGQESPLKRAIKENENAIIQSILSPTSSSPAKDDDDVATNVSKGLSPLLDYLFEDGQLTRIEYDFVDKAHGIQSAQEQVQVLLRILVETKDDEALEVLLKYLIKLDPSSDTIRKLHASLPGSQNKTWCSVEAKAFVNNNGPYLSLTFDLFRDNFSEKRQDFYYGRNQGEVSDSGRDGNEGGGFDGKEALLNDKRQQMTKTTQTTTTKEITDFKDFYLTNGCLETVRNLILDSKESLTAQGWENVLRNMNGLLSTDVLSIKDLLFQIKSLDHQREIAAEKRVEEEVRRIGRERLHQLQQNEFHKEQNDQRNVDDDGQDDDEAGDDNGTRSSNREETLENSSSLVNWDQILYHSFQVWKQRNGVNATFYSLIGIFQESKLYQTADFLLENKMEIQARESEKDEESTRFTIAADVNSGRASLLPTAAPIMLEKSAFLRKFYTPTRRTSSSAGNSSNNISKKRLSSSPSVLSTTKDRVCASPVLSLDLL